jgi:hypothetical protein
MTKIKQILRIHCIKEIILYYFSRRSLRDDDDDTLCEDDELACRSSRAS